MKFVKTFFQIVLKTMPKRKPFCKIFPAFEIEIMYVNMFLILILACFYAKWQ